MLCDALLATLLGLIGLGLARQPLSIAALTGAVALLLAALGRRRVTAAKIVRGASPSLFVFVSVCSSSSAALNERLSITSPDPRRPSALGDGRRSGRGGAGSNLINNVPVTLLALSVAKESAQPIREAFTYGVLAGANIGPP